MSMRSLFKLAMDRELPELWPFPNGEVLNVGAGTKLIPGTTPLDYPEWDADHDRIPRGPGTIAGIHAYHFLEHVREPVKLLKEFQRVLMVGGIVNICVPYYTSQMQAQDLDHKSAFCEDTWRILFSNPYYNKNRISWKFEIGLNIIMAIKERNLALITQLRRTQ